MKYNISRVWPISFHYSCCQIHFISEKMVTSWVIGLGFFFVNNSDTLLWQAIQIITYEGHKAADAFHGIKNKISIALWLMICPESLNILVCIIYFGTVSHFHNWLCKKLLAGCQYFFKFECTCMAFARQFLSLKHERNCYNIYKNEITSNDIYNTN